LNFTNVEGVDLSAALVARYRGTARVIIGDCRDLPFESQSRDVLIVQGGLHHLPQLPSDLERTVGEVHRVLTPGGLFCVVEPWLTPFLSLVHGVCDNARARKLSAKIDALATMIEHERQSYEEWLRQPKVIIEILHKFFFEERRWCRWGKLHFVGRKASAQEGYI
jgi:SAM-dependent methyltransferase